MRRSCNSVTLRGSSTYRLNESSSRRRVSITRRALSITGALHARPLTRRALATAVLRQESAKAHVEALPIQTREERQHLGAASLALGAKIAEQPVDAGALVRRTGVAVGGQRLAQHVAVAHTAQLVG